MADEVLNRLSKLLVDPEITIVGQNIKYDLFSEICKGICEDRGHNVAILRLKFCSFSSQYGRFGASTLEFLQHHLRILLLGLSR